MARVLNAAVTIFTSAILGYDDDNFAINIALRESINADDN